ncbi:Sphingomyelin phosphodiesterase 2, partial [Armadillidium vulgare]
DLLICLCFPEIRGSTDDIDESSNEYAITENVMLITNEIHDWMSQPEQDYGNMPFHIKQLVLTLNKTSTKGSHDDTDRIFSGTRSLCGPCEMLASVVDSILNYIIKNTNVDGAALCSLALGSQGCGPFKGPSWALHIPLPSTLGGHPQISYKFTTSSLKRHTRRYRRQTIHGEERSIDFSGPEDIDYIMCTGDLVPHHIWRINPDSNVHVIRDVTDMILHYFPKTPVYGAIGNHEAYPRDSFPPPEVPEVFSKFGNQWLYDAVSETWERLQRQPLPSTARYAGYYSILIRPRFRLISINTNFCYILN